MPAHPRTRDLLLSRYGHPVRLNTAGAGLALRDLGFRRVVHPLDVAGFAFPNERAAVAWCCLFRERWGYPVLGITVAGDGTAAGVLDLRLAMDERGLPRTDPASPDTADVLVAGPDPVPPAAAARRRGWGSWPGQTFEERHGHAPEQLCGPLCAGHPGRFGGRR